MSRLTGNDISVFQGDINWDVYKNNANFVIIRSSYGVGYVDGKFSKNQSEARRVGIPHGYYHYAYPQYNTPEAEADWFLKTVGHPQEGELLCLDYEENWSGDKVDFCKRFLDRLASNLDGYKGLIYLNESLVNGNDWSPLVSAGYGLWIAKYLFNPSPDATFKTGKWPFAAIYQWTSSQQVPGIPTNVDGDIFYGDIDTFKKYGYSSPPPINPPAPPADTCPAERDKNWNVATKMAEAAGISLDPNDKDKTSDMVVQTIQGYKDIIKSQQDTIYALQHNAPTPPSDPGTQPGMDYKPYLLKIKGALNESKPWWDKYLHDKRLKKIASIINESAV